MDFTWMNAGLSEVQFTKKLANDLPALRKLLNSINCPIEFDRAVDEVQVAGGRIDIVLYMGDDPVFCIECQDKNGALDQTHAGKIIPYMAQTDTENGCVLAYDFRKQYIDMYDKVSGSYNVACVMPIYVNDQIEFAKYYSPYSGKDLGSKDPNYKKVDALRNGMIPQLQDKFSDTWSFSQSYFTLNVDRNVMVHPNLEIIRVDIPPTILGVSLDELDDHTDHVNSIFAKYNKARQAFVTSRDKGENIIQLQIKYKSGAKIKTVIDVLETINTSNFKVNK